jgi:hypothetical protein
VITSGDSVIDQIVTGTIPGTTIDQAKKSDAAKSA